MLASTSRICCSTVAMLLSSVSLYKKQRQLSAMQSRPKKTDACEGVGAHLSMLGCDDVTAAT